MRLTWPETSAPPAGDPTSGLNPLLYSLDVFLPFVEPPPGALLVAG